MRLIIDYFDRLLLLGWELHSFLAIIFYSQGTPLSFSFFKVAFPGIPFDFHHHF